MKRSTNVITGWARLQSAGLNQFFPVTILLCLAVFASAVGQTVTNPLDLSFPERGWALHVDLQEMHIQSWRYDPLIDTLGLEAVSNQLGQVLTIFFGPATEDLTPAYARDSLMAEMQAKGYRLPDLRVYTDREFACAEYFGQSAEYSGEQRHDTWAFAIVDRVWMSIHLSGNKYSRLNIDHWQAFFDSLRIARDFQPRAWDNLTYANQFYLKGRYERAIPYYEKALALCEESGGIPEPNYIVLIDNLGMSYGISGDPAQALATFRFGMERFPEYPMFYYNAACAHAEMKNLDSTLANLERAYQHKSNMLPGEEIPDPFKDDSFRRFWHDREFKRFMRSHQ